MIAHEYLGNLVSFISAHLGLDQNHLLSSSVLYSEKRTSVCSGIVLGWTESFQCTVEGWPNNNGRLGRYTVTTHAIAIDAMLPPPQRVKAFLGGMEVSEATSYLRTEPALKLATRQ